jgi:prepilin signal peptidase PulO-like enzyme (type II secretory pathway)
MIVCTPRGDVTTSSPRAVPIVVAGAVAALVAASLAIDDRRAAAAFLIVGLLTGAAAVVDAIEERIPNRLLLAALLATALGAFVTGNVLAVAAGALLGGLPFLAVLLTRGLGIGDVKLAFVLGAAAGLVHALAAPAMAFVTALATSLYAAARGVRRLPLGPWLWSAFVLSSGVAALVVGGH